MENRIKPGDIVRHFKGNEYEILCFALDSETQEELVVYRALYGEGQVWVRPLAEFLDTVTRDGITRHRFEEIDS